MYNLSRHCPRITESKEYAELILFGVTDQRIRRLLKNYTITEIKEGYWKDGEWNPKDIYILSKN